MSSEADKGVGSFFTGWLVCFLIVGLVITGFYDSRSSDMELASRTQSEAQNMPAGYIMST